MTGRRGPVLVYDGDCGFCARGAAWISTRWPEDGAPRAVAWQALGAEEMAVMGLSEEGCRAAAWWVGPDGRLLRGHRAVAASMVAAGGAWGAAGRLVAAPILSPAAAVAYRVVARSRHRLPGSSPACRTGPE
jgi:predicted DCC family thiol-disulfide oxidoreductase YuxK